MHSYIPMNNIILVTWIIEGPDNRGRLYILEGGVMHLLQKYGLFPAPVAIPRFLVGMDPQYNHRKLSRPSKMEA